MRGGVKQLTMTFLNDKDSLQLIHSILHQKCQGLCSDEEKNIKATCKMAIFQGNKSFEGLPTEVSFG